jgi:hypothetical protein
MRRIAQATSWILLFSIAALSVVPPDLRPVTILPHDMEHAALYFLAGCAFGLVYADHFVTTLVGLSAFTLVSGRFRNSCGIGWRRGVSAALSLSSHATSGQKHSTCVNPSAANSSKVNSWGAALLAAWFFQPTAAQAGNAERPKLIPAPPMPWMRPRPMGGILHFHHDRSLE